MYKKFVQLNSDKSPSKNPYEVCTFMGEPLKPQHPEWRTAVCGYNRDCSAAAAAASPQNSTLAKVLTLEDEIRKIHRKTQENLYQRPFRKTCQYEDRFVTCVVPQRTPYELKRHAIMREKFLKTKQEMQELLHDADDVYLDHESLIKLNEPPASGDGGRENEEQEYDIQESDEVIRPEIASPECSMDYIYVPSKRLLELKSPKSGLFVNETQPPNFYPSDEIPYSTYNPRVLQEQFDEQYLKKIDVIQGKTSNDLWTWNVGLQQKESDLDREFIEAVVPQFDCNNLDLAAYKIPDDLEKTFTAGIVFGTKAVTPEKPSRKKSHFNRPLEIGCIYLAYVEGFRLNADFWTAETMNNIIKMAEKLITESSKMNYKSPDNDYDIIPQISERQATVNIKLHFTGPLKSEPNIYKALTLYFSKYNACILCSNKLYLLIWKRCKNFFYIYDPNGRRENCERDFLEGKCALMSTHFVEHLVYLIVNISRANMEDEFNLYEIYLSSYGTIPNPLPKKPFPKNFRKLWSVVNDSYAVIPGCNNGIFQPATYKEDNASMLISVMAILYNHIERANMWKMEQIDELIRLGTAYYKSLRRNLKLKDSQHVTITDLPDKYVLGTFKASLKKMPFMYTGTVTDYCKRYQDSLLTTGLNELFNNNWDSGLLQIDNSVLGVWKDQELFYVYDPFRRGKAGQVLDPEDYKTNGTAILQIHANFDSLLRMIYQNAFRMRRGGKFFLHALLVGCIKPIMDGKPRKLRYPKLKLTPETYVKPKEKNLEDDEEKSSEEEKKDEQQEKKKAKKSKNSAKKTKDKKNLLEKVCSIHSLDAKDRLPSYNDSDVVEGLLENIICEIINKLPESMVGRPHLYKRAGRVLLKSDKEYLENLQYLVKHDKDYDNVDVIYRTEPDSKTPLITLEEELEIPSNFQNLPDGSWIIFGNLSLQHTNDEQSKLRGLLSAIVTVVLTTKYKISTWSSKLIDYSTNSCENFSEDFQNYQYALGTLLHNRIPKLSIGEQTFQVKVQQIFETDPRKSLRQVLLESLINFNRLLIICQRFSCLLMKRYNFLYMFTGFPNNAVGYRKCITGPASLLRFIELDSLIRRIEFGCNPQGCDITNYVVIPVKVRDIAPESKGRYRQWPNKMENQLYKTSLEKKKREVESKKSKLQLLQEELDKESLRIKTFLEDKATKIEEREEELARSNRASYSQQKVREKGGKDCSDEKVSEVTLIYGRQLGGEDSNDDSEGVGEEEQECLLSPKHEFNTEVWKAQEECLRRKLSEREEELTHSKRPSFNQQKSREKVGKDTSNWASYTRQSSSYTTENTLIYGRQMVCENFNDDSEEVAEKHEECLAFSKQDFGNQISKSLDNCLSRKFSEREEKLSRTKRESFSQQKCKEKGGRNYSNRASYTQPSCSFYTSDSTLINNRQMGGEDDDLEQVEEEEEECLVLPKHEFGTEISKARDECLRPRLLLYGYRMREKDLLYKIQGSKALEGRDICEMDKIKPCSFASAMAILSAILKPLNEWTSQRIDQVIDSSLILTDKIEDMSSSYERILKNLAIDDYKFDIWIKQYEPIGLIGNLLKQLERVTSQRKYIILQTENCSYAIYRDEYYHLFDPYPSMELTNMDTEEQQHEEGDSKKLPNYPKDIKCYGERNTASWILFADCDSLVKYLNQRSHSLTWKEDGEYNFQVVDIISYKKSSQNSVVLQLLTDMGRCSIRGEPKNSICAYNETIDWLEYCLPIWSRLNRRNSSGRYRGMAVTKLKKFDIEIDKRLWSLWGNLHPQAPVFESSSRGKQFFACCVVALCAARLYRLADWSSQLLDSITINGDHYFRQSLQDIKCEDHQFTLEDLNRECYLDNIKFVVHIEAVAYGILYSRPYYKRMNLAEGLVYFFNNHHFGILQCFRKSLAIGYVPGHDGGYFMFDCQSRDHPLFPKGQGASYLLRTKYLQILLYCIVVTLNIPYYNVEFTLHKVDMLYEGQSVEET